MQAYDTLVPCVEFCAAWPGTCAERFLLDAVCLGGQFDACSGASLGGGGCGIELSVGGAAEVFVVRFLRGVDAWEVS